MATTVRCVKDGPNNNKFMSPDFKMPHAKAAVAMRCTACGKDRPVSKKDKVALKKKPGGFQVAGH